MPPNLFIDWGTRSHSFVSLKLGTNTQFDMLKMILMRHKLNNAAKAIYRLEALGLSPFSVVWLLWQTIRSNNWKLGANTQFDMLKTMAMRKILKNTFKAFCRLEALGLSLFFVPCLLWQTMRSKHLTFSINT